MNKSFQEAIIKFNSLSMQTDAVSDNASDWTNLYQDVSKNVSKTSKQLVSQSCQTEPEYHPPGQIKSSCDSDQQFSSQHCQTDESHLSLTYKPMFKLGACNGATNNNGNYCNAIQPAKIPIKGSVMTSKVQGCVSAISGPESQDGYISMSRSQYSQQSQQLRYPRHHHKLRPASHRYPKQQRSRRPMTSLGLSQSHNMTANYPHHHLAQQYDFYQHQNNNYVVMSGPGVYSTLV